MVKAMIDTQVFNCCGKAAENGTVLAGRIIRSGGLVAFPTETVYGLGANGLDGEAVRKIFAAKGRPDDNPLILHIAKKSDVKELWTHVPTLARQLMDTFWPGPLTIIFNRSDIVPDEVTAGLNTVAVRMSENKTALALIRSAGVPIAAPSANISGRPSPTTAKHVVDDLGGRIDVILDGGPCKFGIESTVISIVGRPTILRPGAITREMLETVIGHVELAHSITEPLSDDEAAESPGMKHKHYSPNAEVIIARGSKKRMADIIRREYDAYEEEGKRCVIFASEETEVYYRGRRYDVLGSLNDRASMCAALFSKLRQYSDIVDVIFAEAIPTEALGLAYMNRLLRAAGFKVLTD